MNHSAVEMFRRMTFGASPAIVFLTIISTALVAIGAYFWSVVDNLKIPITPGLPEVATFLPVVNFVAMKYLIKTPGGQPRGGAPAWSLRAGIISILLVIVDTFVITQSINNIPMTSISCPLERTWHGYFNKKDVGSIKVIQDALNCCGLKTVREQAWPFANKNTPADTCSTTFNRNTPCFGPWSQKHQLSASMFTTLAIVMLMSKVMIFAVYRRRARNQPLAATQRRIGSATRNGSSAENSGSQVAGLRVRPDERTKYTDNDYDDVESVVDEASRLLENNENGTQYEAPRLLEEASGSILPSGDDSIWRNEHSRTHPSRQES